MNRKEIPELLDLAQTLLEQWLRYREYYLHGISQEEITGEDEADFLDTTSAIAQNSRKLGQRIDEKTFPIKRTEVAQLLRATTSIAYFRQLPDYDRTVFYKDWHVCRVYISRAMGGLKFLNEGYVPPRARKAKGKSPADQLKNLPWTIIILVAALLGAGWYFFLR